MSPQRGNSQTATFLVSGIRPGAEQTNRGGSGCTEARCEGRLISDTPEILMPRGVD